MKKTIFIFISIFLTMTSYSQEHFWTEISEDRIAHLEKLDRGTQVLRHKTFSVDIVALKSTLSSAPNRELGIESNLIISFPNALGQLQDYIIYEAPVMHHDLSYKHQNIKSYVGVGVDDKTALIRFSTTIFGFHAMILSGKTSTTYIDPFTKDLSHYSVYFKEHTLSYKTFECLTESATTEPEMQISSFSTNQANLNGSLRKYRLAMACTTEYAAFHVNAAGLNSGTIAQKKAAVLAAMNVTMTRVNGIYERDLSLTMELIPNNEDIIFINSDSFSNNNPGLLINQSQSVIDSVIGFNFYDIGHTVSTGGGGLAQLYSPCSTSKARGITGISSPVGDPFDVDYLSHEIGHQFGANHTFNNSCSGNRNNATAVEPGSGSTIMSYAGICPPNVQGNSDAHFHAISLAEISSFILGWGACSVNTNNGNTPPTISPLSNYIIPKGTAFVLRGNASDSNEDALTYSWEQTNQQISTQPPLATNTSGPSFRSLPPTDSPDRYMPDLSSVLQGNLNPNWEAVPTIGRSMSFALIVRDNNLNGGEFTRANMSVTTSNSIGPFKVTSQNSAVNWAGQSEQTVTWDVAGTTNTPVSTSTVNILLSIDGGLSFDHVLATSTPNDGSEIITVPNIATSNARIMVEAVNNIFYAVNSTSFSIGDCALVTNSAAAVIPDGAAPNQPGVPLISTLTITEDITLDNIAAAINITHSWIGDLKIELEHPNGTQVVLYDRNCNNGQANLSITFQQEAPVIACASPATGTFSPVGDLSVFDGLSSQGEWKLIITDYWDIDSGALTSWTLDLGCSTMPVSVENFALSNFKLYPNPNQGDFILEFDSDSTQDIQISVFDLRGRKVLHQTFENTGKINQPIRLNTQSAGVYIVKIEDGIKNKTEKIIIRK